MKKRIAKVLAFLVIALGLFVFVGSDTGVFAADNSSKYVLNKNSKKFHLSSCSSVNDMAKKNKIFSDESPEEIMAKGYVPCKKCHPELGAAYTSDSDDEVAVDYNYVLNKNTKKFHRPGCSSVPDIKKKNRANSYLSRSDIIALGFKPCKKCKP